MNKIRTKICGLKTPEHVKTATSAGAAYVGFVFVPKSSRYISLEVAAGLAANVEAGVAKVALTVDADDAALDDIIDQVPLDMLQLHGSETPERLEYLRDRYRLPLIKAVGVGNEDDLAALTEYGRVADQLLVDTKPALATDLPGGSGLSFDWRLIAGRRWTVPWMLAGGLNAGNVAKAVRMAGAQQVDVSSGVETAPGQKDIGLIESFLGAVSTIS